MKFEYIPARKEKGYCGYPWEQDRYYAYNGASTLDFKSMLNENLGGIHC
jgi:hypothetical protein